MRLVATRTCATYFIFLSWVAGDFSHDVRAQSSVSSTTLRPFVTSVIPVVGRGGAVGGISIDADGVLSRTRVDDGRQLRNAWLKASQPVAEVLSRPSDLRMVSLTKLETALAQHLELGERLPDALFLLAGLRRIEYVFVLPEQHDLVLAGPAEGWRMNEQGEIVGRSSGQPMLRLDDLMVALRSAGSAARGQGISCSIDPTAEGLVRLQRLLARRAQLNAPNVKAQIEQAVGPQQITLTGVPPDSHFASVLVAADFIMKRLAMRLEPSPVPDFPSYLELMESGRGFNAKFDAPRWWLAVDYEPLLRNEDGLAWHLRGQGVQALTEDGYLSAAGQIVKTGRTSPLAKKWADNMTAKYAELSAVIPAFGKLRNCMDLAVVAALITREHLFQQAGCQLPLLLDANRTGGSEYNVPKSVASQASFVTVGRKRVVCVSGGVLVDSWSVLEHVEQDATLTEINNRLSATKTDAWWWD